MARTIADVLAMHSDARAWRSTFHSASSRPTGGRQTPLPVDSYSRGVAVCFPRPLAWLSRRLITT